ncbi:MAG: hypothetical protein A2X59_03020 [Nitrospirae bacterium GWC2_42_7]|nr:MAG: hypothetical protein A2X59_03020 [Nitrospirae bacterium GWC2_42_7]
MKLPNGHDKEMRKYTMARYKSFLDNVGDRPFWQWVAIEDCNTCVGCLFLNKKVFWYDDPIWKVMLRRLHKGCRCRFRAYTEKDLSEKGLEVIKSDEILSRLKILQ